MLYHQSVYCERCESVLGEGECRNCTDTRNGWRVCGTCGTSLNVGTFNLPCRVATDRAITSDIAAQTIEVHRLSKLASAAFNALDTSQEGWSLDPAYRAALDNWHQAYQTLQTMTGQFTPEELTLFRSHHLDSRNLPW